MRVLADVNIEREIIARLRADGHTVERVLDHDRQAPDPVVLATSVGFDAVLVSHDKDFGELVYRHGQQHLGVVLCRIGGLSAETKCDLVSGLFAAQGAALIGVFTVLTPGKVRMSRPA